MFLFLILHDWTLSGQTPYAGEVVATVVLQVLAAIAPVVSVIVVG